MSKKGVLSEEWPKRLDVLLRLFFKKLGEIDWLENTSRKRFKNNEKQLPLIAERNLVAMLF
ncbi:hypothetical protein [Bacillus xiapuensis]|uniref:hypothetical protein n=1 Tax=Bacillus xiapuensis TaxID=2014075 RepID=UPI001E4B5D5C|nr:hypothetical protein [Bacillus xiapuensis]